jgi:CDGSH-type Zn-finger protein
VAGFRIQASPNGPYIARGPLTVVDAAGNEHEVADGKNVALCRCGGSTTKPFCDGTHSKIGFKAAEAAVRRSA